MVKFKKQKQILWQLENKIFLEDKYRRIQVLITLNDKQMRLRSIRIFPDLRGLWEISKSGCRENHISANRRV